MGNDLKAALKGKLSPEEIAQVYRSYDVVGDIAVIRIPEPLLQFSGIIAEVLMQQHGHVKAVWRQSSPVSGDFRLRELEWVAGETRSETVHREHGCLFKVDVKECYFSPRLGFERLRIANLVGDGEVVLNMFAGVGCYSITIAKHSRVAKVYSMDINPVAVTYMQENILLNKVVGKVVPMEGDAAALIKSKLEGVVDRVLMPLPERAYEYLSSALSAVKPSGGWVHYYGFEHASGGEDPVEKVKAKIGEWFGKHSVEFELRLGRVVRETGPNWHQVVVDAWVET